MAFDILNASDIAIDVSHHQGDIDWPKVAAAGKTVAMVKASEGRGSDDMWAVNRDGAAAAGILVIPYMFLTSLDPDRQASFFQATAGLKPGSPYALDWEGNGAPPARLVEAVGGALQAVTHRVPLGYWGLSPPGIPTAAMKTWPRWIPRYGINNGKPDPRHPVTEPCLFWQYTSAAKVAGIAKPADASLFAGTPRQLDTWVKTGALP